MRALAMLMALAASGLWACGGVPTPTVIEQAAAKLDSREATHLTTARPKLMREAREHLRRARRAVLEEDADAAELYGHLALQRYETAAGFTGRDLVSARLGAMDTALARVTEKADALAAERAALLKVKAAEDRLAALDRADVEETAERRRSRLRLVEARRRQAAAVAAGAAQGAPGPFGAGQALLESGLEALEGDLFVEAREAAAGAMARFDEAIARSRDAAAAEAEAQAEATTVGAAARDAVDRADLARVAAIGRGLDRSDRARFEQGAALVELARRQLADGRHADATLRAEAAITTLAAKPDEGTPAPVAAGGETSAAEAAIVEARTRRATALGEGRDRRCPDVFRGVDALIELAVDRQKAGASAEALTAATRAQERLSTCDAAPPATAEALQAVDPGGRLAAEQAMSEAQVALAKARASRVAAAQIEAGAGLITDARGWYAAGAWGRATALAEQARGMLTGALPAAGAPDPALAEARAALQRSRALGQRHSDRSGDPLYAAAKSMEAEAERLLTAGRGDEALRVANQAATTWQSIPPRGPKDGPSVAPALAGAAAGAALAGAIAGGEAQGDDWRPAYREILGTLALRDRADGMATSADARGQVDRGNRNLAEARRAYQGRDYGEARRAAALAAADFRAAMSGVPLPDAPPTPPPTTAAAPDDPPSPTPAEPAEPAEPIDRAAEMKAVADAAAREALENAAAERAAAERAARQAADAEAAERRVQAARDAEAAAEAALAAAEARRARESEERAAADARLAEARSWVDGARSRQIECLESGCPGRDPVGWARAEEALQAAVDALDRGATDTAVSSAERAITLMDAAAAAPRPFTVPADQGEVTRDGDRLRLRTRLRFEMSRDSLRPGAGPALDALARVIAENRAAIERVRLVGFTDDRGRAESNRALSARRAETVRRALIERGVAPELLLAEGRGEAEPAFSNDTAEGRRKNRRVEIRLELREDAR